MLQRKRAVSIIRGNGIIFRRDPNGKNRESGLPGQGHEQHLQGTPFGAGFLLHPAHITGIFNDAIQNGMTAILMDDLAPTEEHRHLAAIAVLKKTADMAQLVS